jgi:hypothetical protein
MPDHTIVSGSKEYASVENGDKGNAASLTGRVASSATIATGTAVAGNSTIACKQHSAGRAQQHAGQGNCQGNNRRTTSTSPPLTGCIATSTAIAGSTTITCH